MGPKGKVVEEEKPEEEEVPEVPKSGYGKFEYVNQTLYVGEWRLLEIEGQPARKVKHGKGKIIFAGTTTPSGHQVGMEEYDGEWVDDQMHGQGCYKFTSGNEYAGDFEKGVMNGYGKMIYADGSSYEGQWKHNLMSGEGLYIDSDKIKWEGIFVDGQYDSKIQKKLQAEKIIKDKIIRFQEKSKIFVEQFTDAFAKSDKKTFKDNLTPFFGSADNCLDFINVEAYPKFEDKPADKWNEIVKGMADEVPTHTFKALSNKDESTMLAADQILVEQLKSKPGGQLVECVPVVEEGGTKIVLCELPSESWVIVYFSE